MAAPHRAPALERLLAEVNALWPGRDRSSDGWIGDTAHRNRRSDHNPDSSGRVHAIDIDEDLTAGGSTVGKASGLVAQIIRDLRVAYVIYEGLIWQNPAAFPGKGGWHTYTGPNAHAHHVHVSIRYGVWAADARPWGLVRTTSGGGGTGGPLPTAPDLDPIAPIEEDDLMSHLNYEEQRRLLAFADNGAPRLEQAHAALAAIAAQTGRLPRVEEQGDITLAALQNVTNGVVTLLGRPGADVDIAALASSLADTLGDELVTQLLDELGARIGRPT